MKVEPAKLKDFKFVKPKMKSSIENQSTQAILPQYPPMDVNDLREFKKIAPNAAILQHTDCDLSDTDSASETDAYSPVSLYLSELYSPSHRNLSESESTKLKKAHTSFLIPSNPAASRRIPVGSPLSRHIP